MSIPEIPGPFPDFIQNPADFFLLLYESAFSSHTYYMQSGNTLPFRNVFPEKKFYFCNYSAGLRIHCADRKKVYHGQATIPSPKAALHGFLPVTVRVLNSYLFFYDQYRYGRIIFSVIVCTQNDYIFPAVQIFQHFQNAVPLLKTGISSAVYAKTHNTVFF